MVEGLIVGDTPDGLFDHKQAETKKVKNPCLSKSKKAGLSVAIDHPFEKKALGGFEILCNEAFYKVKNLCRSGSRLSYQSHEKAEKKTGWLLKELPW